MQHPKCCTKNLTIFKFDPKSSNMLQHIAAGWPNVRNMLCPTMLQDVVLKCCERLTWPSVVDLWSPITISVEQLFFNLLQRTFDLYFNALLFNPFGD